jgi:diguanylate cyclase
MSQGDARGGALRNNAAAEPTDEHDRTMVFARRAVAQLKALNLPATPRNYEIWYAYATGHYPSLNQFLNDMLARRVELPDKALEEIGARFVSPGNIKDRVDTVGSKVANEIVQILAAIGTTIGTSGVRSDELAQADGDAAAARTGDALRAIAEKMVNAADAMDGDKRRLENVLNASKAEITQLRADLRTIRDASTTDPLTGLANRKSLDQSLQHAIAEAEQRGEPLTLMMGDIDNFTAFNDSWGHLTGDQVLGLVAKEMKQLATGRNIVGRYGGEEFAVIMPDSQMQSARDMADEIRQSIMSRVIVSRSTNQNLGRVTVSFGIVSAHPGESAKALVARAEAFLEASKAQGGNHVIDDTGAGAPVRAAVA